MDRDLKETVLDYVHMKNQQIINQIIQLKAQTLSQYLQYHLLEIRDFMIIM